MEHARARDQAECRQSEKERWGHRPSSIAPDASPRLTKSSPLVTDPLARTPPCALRYSWSVGRRHDSNEAPCSPERFGLRPSMFDLTSGSPIPNVTGVVPSVRYQYQTNTYSNRTFRRSCDVGASCFECENTVVRSRSGVAPRPLRHSVRRGTWPETAGERERP